MSETNLPARQELAWKYFPTLMLFVLAFAVRYHFLTTYPYPMMLHEQDAVGYMDVAKDFLGLHLPGVAGRPPGYPVVIALFALLPVPLEFAARLASIFMDALVVVPLFSLARISLSCAGAAAACLLWTFFVFSLIFSPSPLSQSSCLCYLLAGIALLYHGLQEERAAWLGASGFLFALCYLARPEGIVGFACGAALCLVWLFRTKAWNRQGLVRTASFFIGFLILAGPFLYALRVSMGTWTISPLSAAHVKTADVVLTLNAQGELQKTSGAGMSVWREYYGTVPVFLGAVKANFLAFTGVYWSTFPVWHHLVTGLGILALAFRCRWRMVFLAIPIAVIAPSLVVTIPKTHSYLYPAYAVSFVCFAACLEVVGSWVGRGVGRLLPAQRLKGASLVLPVVVLAIVCSIAWSSYRQADENYRSPGLVREALTTERIYKGAGEFIKRNSKQGDVIMTRWGVVGYFADRPVLTLPKGGVKAVVDYGRKNGARFLLADTNSILSRRQELMELLDPLQGKRVDPQYGIEAVTGNYFDDLDAGFVLYRYK